MMSLVGQGGDRQPVVACKLVLDTGELHPNKEELLHMYKS